MSSSLLRMLALAALCTAVPTVAQAQIYSWRDSSGTLVLSDTPKDASATTFAVPGVRAAIRTTKKAVSKRAAEFEPLILQHSAAYGVRPDLVRGVIQAESAFNPMARSPKGAMGLMQLMPGTAAVYGVHNAYDPAQNIRAGVAYLSSLLAKYKQNEELALAAYNAGPGAVKKYHGRVPPYRETRDYIARIHGNVGTGVWPAVNRAVYSAVEVLSGRQVTRLSNVPSPKSSAVRAGTN